MLNEFGRRAMLYGGNPYRAKAYLRAAERIALLTEPIGELIAQHRLREIPGAGPAIAQFITQLYEAGSHPLLDSMRAEIPESVLEMLTIPGLRPEKILRLHQELGITTLEELQEACNRDRLKNVKGLAPGDASTAICMACDTKLSLEGIPEIVQKRHRVGATENVTFTRLEGGPHHDGVRFSNGAEVTLQELGPGVKGYVDDALSSFVWKKETVEAM